MRQPPHSPEGLFRSERKARRKRFQAEACRGKQSDLISRGRMRRKRQKRIEKPPDGANFFPRSGKKIKIRPKKQRMYGQFTENKE